MEPAREILWNIGPGTQVSMYVLAALTAGVFGYGVYLRLRIWRAGRPAPAIGDIGAALGRLRRHALAQIKVARSPAAWLSHACIFWGFVVLFIGTCLVAIEHYGLATFLHGKFYLVFSFTLDLFGMLFIVGILIALARRTVASRYRPPATKVDLALLGLLLVIALTGFVIEAYRIVATRERAAFETVSFVGWAVAGALERAGVTPEAAQSGHFAVWWVHMIAVYAFLGAIPYTKMLHIFTAPASIFRTEPTVPGRLEPVSMEQVEETGKFGVEGAADFSFRQLLSFDACTQCGRCENVCPAYATDKPLSPMKLVLDLQQGARSAASLHGRVIQADTLFACTTCRACVEECPVLIDHVAVIVDMRRFLVGEGQIRGSEQTALRNIGTTGNPWGLPNADRMDWAEGLDVPTTESNPDSDVLLWVGCAGAFDRRNQKVTRALVKLFHAAGVNFAVLGKRERCTGDPARRLGDEFTFQEAARQNVATLRDAGPKRIVTACAHCFNTLANEYPDFDGHYDVVHHTMFLRELIEAKRLPAAQVRAEDGPAQHGADSIVFHDPCYLARYNGQYDPPRDTLRKGLNLALPLLEPDRTREAGFCCGAGGGRMWADEDPAKRVNVARYRQLKETGAKTIATGCPYCLIMLDDAANADDENAPQVQDVAELLADALAGDAGGHPAAGAGPDLVP